MLGVSRIEGYTDSGEEHYTGWDITRDAHNQITGLEKIWDEWRDIEPDYLNVSYCYNDQGMRTRKSIDEAALPRESVYYYNGTQLIFEAQYQAGALLRVLGFQYDPQGSPLYLTLWNNPADAAQYTVYRYQYNLLGEIEKLLLVKSVNGTSVTYPNTEAASYTYSAFGKIMAQSGEMAAINPIRYKGYYYDIETGWYYLQSRYYSPEWGIFLTLDDPGILLEVGEDPLALDLVAYCQNDPVNLSDPEGYSPGMLFNSASAAALDFAKLYYNVSLYIRFEISSLIYAIRKNNRIYYSYTPYIIGQPHSCRPLDGIKYLPDGSWSIAAIHTHPNSNYFSEADKRFARANYLALYVVTPNKKIRVYQDTRRGFQDILVYSRISVKSLSFAEMFSLRLRYMFAWNLHVKVNCGFGCRYKRWPAW